MQTQINNIFMNKSI